MCVYPFKLLEHFSLFRNCIVAHTFQRRIYALLRHMTLRKKELLKAAQEAPRAAS